ncbi:hypothetical protein Rumeso_03955 [Rubellimicrobium mesophilum DSM 19309]|uniref:SAM-dependent methyltransferase n=1 Tax=Rubellimicrobium mesophilum DSM 19309 TaxID=442562 RepID=A0A017HJG1_9RHOB|nr:50S ribosomal protein L11 methyltransferase [Rubellimicrobium mesophilum]EYD74481.1 hypothetical protein Rumeso_03955 [Rubellimicrobium mesophilum DSM 19309]
MTYLPDAEAFIRANLPLVEVPGTGLRLHLAGPRSGLSRLVPPGGTPYWAHAWPGGVALALHLAAQPETVQGRSVWEIGAGSGLVSLAALRAGAEAATAVDTDPLAAVATRVNAEANGLPAPRVLIRAAGELSLDWASAGASRGRSAVLAGDVFYDAASARHATEALDGAAAALGPDAPILVGDIGRRFLPRDRLEPLACYPVRDVGDPPSAPLREGWVFRWTPLP